MPLTVLIECVSMAIPVYMRNPKLIQTNLQLKCGPFVGQEKVAQASTSEAIYEGVDHEDRGNQYCAKL